MNGYAVQFLFDSGCWHNFVNDRLVQILEIQPTISDLIYKVYWADGRVRYINDVIHSLAIYIDTYKEQLDFHLINLYTTNVILGYPWFFNKNSFFFFSKQNILPLVFRKVIKTTTYKKFPQLIFIRWWLRQQIFVLQNRGK